MSTTWLQQHVQNKSAPACPLELAVCGSASLASRTAGFVERSIRHKYKWKQMFAPIPANNANAFAIKKKPFNFDSTMKESTNQRLLRRNLQTGSSSPDPHTLSLHFSQTLGVRPLVAACGFSNPCFLLCSRQIPGKPLTELKLGTRLFSTLP